MGTRVQSSRLINMQARHRGDANVGTVIAEYDDGTVDWAVGQATWNVPLEDLMRVRQKTTWQDVAWDA